MLSLGQIIKSFEVLTSRAIYFSYFDSSVSGFFGLTSSCEMPLMRCRKLLMNVNSGNFDFECARKSYVVFLGDFQAVYA